MSTEEIQMKCNELCGKSAAELTSGFSRFYGESGMWKSIRRIIQDIYREGEMKAKNAYCEGLNKGRLEGIGGTALICLALGTVGVVMTKVKQSKERKAVWEVNRQMQEDIIDFYEERLHHMKEMYEQAKEEPVCLEKQNVRE